MGQSKLHSILESIVNILVGFGISLLAQLAIFAHVGISIPMSTNLYIVALFTVVSLIRSYTLRRIFNAWHMRKYNS